MKNYSGASKTFSLVQLLIMMIVSLKCQNLFCNANFQSYVLTSSFSGSGYTIQYRQFPSDSCWHFKGETVMEIQKPSYAPYTKMVELSINGPNYFLCQNSSLTVKKLYNFTFQYGMHFDMASTTVNLTMNNVQVSQKTSLLNELYPNLGSLTYIFVADRILNQFCVGSQETWNIPRGGTATLVDNFELKLIPNQPRTLLFNYFYSFRSGLLFIQCFNETNEEYRQFFDQNAILYFDGVSYQNLSFQLNGNQSLTINQSISPYSNSSTISMTILNSIRIQNCLYDLTIIFEHLQDQMPIIVPDPDPDPNTENEQQSSISANSQYSGQYEMLDDIQNSLFSWLLKHLPHIRLFGGTYLFQNIITFYNIVVLYNFMNLPSQPKTSHSKLQNLALLYFSDDQIIQQLFQNIFGRSFQTVQNKINGFLQIDVQRLKIQKQKQNYIWFGSLGLSQSFLNNNFTNIILVAFLLLKFLIIKIIIKIISFCKPKFNKKNKMLMKTFYTALSIELIICSPSMAISAMSLFLKTGSYIFINQINFILQLFYFSIIIHLPAFYFMLKYPEFYSKKIKANNKVSYSFNQKRFWNQIISQMKLFLHILIPCIITISNNIAFSIITTLVLSVLVYLFIKGFQFLSLFRKIFNFIFILIITAHHLSFMLMYVTSYTNLQYLQSADQYCSFLGIFVIMTVIFGGLFELLECIIEFLLEYMIPAFKKVLSFFIWKQDSPKIKILKINEKNFCKFTQNQNKRNLIPIQKIYHKSKIKFTRPIPKTNLQILQTPFHSTIENTISQQEKRRSHNLLYVY